MDYLPAERISDTNEVIHRRRRETHPDIHRTVDAASAQRQSRSSKRPRPVSWLAQMRVDPKIIRACTGRRPVHRNFTLGIYRPVPDLTKYRVAGSIAKGGRESKLDGLSRSLGLAVRGMTTRQSSDLAEQRKAKGTSLLPIEFSTSMAVHFLARNRGQGFSSPPARTP
jgi:hypothetical protein